MTVSTNRQEIALNQEAEKINKFARVEKENLELLEIIREADKRIRLCSIAHSPMTQEKSDFLEKMRKVL